MTFMTFATIVLAVACGFGMMVYFIVAAWHWKRGHRKTSGWYYLLALTYLAATVILVGRFLGFFQVLPRGTSLILLAPIFAVPPGIQLVAWLQARRLLKAQRG